MRSAAIRILCVSVRSRLDGACVGGAAQQAPPSTTDPRVGLKAGLRDAGVAARNMEQIATLPKPEGFFDPKAPAGRSPRRRRAPADRTRPRANPAAPPPFDPVAANRLGFRQLRPRLQRQARHRRQLPRLQHLRRRAPEQAEAARVGRLPRRPGRRVGARQPAVHVGGADARPPRLRHAGRADAGQRRTLPRRPHLRHHRSQQAEAARGDSDLPRLAHAHAGDRSERQGEPLRLRLRHRRRALGGGARRLLRPQDPRTTRTPRSSASTSSRCRSRRRRRRRSSTVRASSRTRRPATSPGCGRAAITARARSARATTNQCHDITVFPEVGLAAGACSGNGILLDIRIRCIRCGSITWRTRTSPTGTRRRSTTTARR